MKYADLHVHTHYSDSTFSPEEVISCAKSKGLAAVAICDHDSVDGIEPSIKEGELVGVEVVPGIELTVEKSDAEIHMLGFFIDWKSAWFRERLKKIQESRVERVYKMVERLRDFNVVVDPAEVFKLAGKGTVGRLHMAQAMLKAGVIKTIREAFDKYIGYLESCYVTKLNFSPEEAVKSILKVGGVPVMAHPAVMGKDEYIDEMIGYGLRGIEAYHTDHKSAVTKKYEELAREKGLIATGGSDCHGLGKGRILLGGVRVPYEVVDRLREESRRIRSEAG